ncbi:MAG: lipopolysaccharide assembly protein LapA domain-containing protein [Syntrophales bacterium]
MNSKLALILVLSGIILIFVTQNVAAVEVTFLLWTISLSRALLIFFTLAIGILIGWFLHGYVEHRQVRRTFLRDD